jgi:hypothetical protein
MFYGVIYHRTPAGKALIVIGLIISLAAVIGWAMEPLEEPHGEHGDGDDHDGPDEPEELEEPGVVAEASEPVDD